MAVRKSSRTATGSDRQVLSVSAFARQSKKLLEQSFPDIWIQGEVSRVTDHSSGHAYFTLKDDSAAISCAFFRGSRGRSAAQPEDGAEMLVRGRATVYEANGRFQVVVSYMERAGEGALQQEFERLKRKLYDEGLFDEDHKKPLPWLPKRVGLITSPTGAAVRDIITTFQRRFAGVALRVYPVRVQGETAAAEIADAIELAGERKDCDALIVSRGGGSLEDLMAFNDERVARAIFHCEIPVVAGVGHEIDVTIADFVADARAPTPTAAAELLSPDGDDILHSLGVVGARLALLATQDLERKSQFLDLTARRLVHPARRLEQWNERLDALLGRQLAAFRQNASRLKLNVGQAERKLAENAPSRRLAEVKERSQNLELRLTRAAQELTRRQSQLLDSAGARLNAISPIATLDRGYAILENGDGTIIRDAGTQKAGDKLTARLASGRLGVTVDRVEPQS